MKILHVSPTFYPAIHWGGPIYSTLGLCNALASLPGSNVKVLTTDSAGPLLSQRIDSQSLPQGFPDGFEVKYCRRIAGSDISIELLCELPRLVRWADVIHLTAVYSFPTLPTLLAARIFNKPVMWSTRGALMRWRGSSRLKTKFLWEQACKLLLDKQRSMLHVTSSDELESAEARLPSYTKVLIPNAVDLPQTDGRRQWMPGGVCRLLFVGRIHPIKALDNLLYAMSVLSSELVSLNICGTGAGVYEMEIRQLAQQLNLDNVSFSGHVEGQAKADAFSNADIVVLPSHSENFGMVVIEALAHGVPVLASTGTPWESLLTMKCGAWTANTPASLAKAIQEMRNTDLALLGANGRAWVAEEFDWSKAAARMSDCYKDLCVR